MAEKKKNGGLIAIFIGIVVIMLIILFLFFYLLMNGDTVDNNDEPSTESYVSGEYVMEDEPMFAKYGNFKNYDSMSAIILSRMSESSDAEIENEIFEYWFTLVRYGDYEDAYSFIDTDSLFDYGIDYDYEDFMWDCRQIRYCDTEEGNTGLEAEILSYTMVESTETNFPFGEMHMAIITESSDSEKAYFLPFYITSDYKIIPFDLTSSSPYVEYGNVDEKIELGTEATESVETTEAVSTEVTEAASVEETNTVESTEGQVQ